MPTAYTSLKANQKLTVGAAASVAGAALGIVGTLFMQGNLVSTQVYTTSRVINNTQAYEVTTQTGSTQTGGLKSGGTLGNYQAVTIVSPQSATNAPLNGVATGTGIVNFVMIDPVAPQVGGRIACSIASVNTRGSGGALVLNRVIATGATIFYSTGAFAIGPNESFRCSLGNAPSPSSNIKVLLRIVPSQVTN